MEPVDSTEPFEAVRTPVAGPASLDRASLSVTALASAVLAREFRPRAGEIRQLAAAVLAHDAKSVARKAKKAAKAGKEKNAKGGAKRKLSKIPFQGSIE